jgi:hypothetical protein
MSTGGTRQKKRINKGQWQWEAGQICLEEVIAERALGLPPLRDPANATDAEMPGAAKYGDGLLPALRTKKQKLEALGLPDAIVDDFVAQTALEHFLGTVDNFEKAQRAALKGDSATFSKFWVQGRSHDQVADTLWTHLGVPLCAGD